MASFWSSPFTNHQFISHYPWSYDTQGVNFAPNWPLACHPQYQRPANAFINDLESTSSASNGAARDRPSAPGPSSATPRALTYPRPANAEAKQISVPTRSAKPKQPEKASSPIATQAQSTSPVAHQLIPAITSTPRTNALPMVGHTNNVLGRFLLQSPSTYSVVSASLLRRGRPPTWREDYLPPSASWIRRRLLGFKLMITEEQIYINRRLVLNPLLRYPSPHPSTYYFDLRCNPFSAYLFHLPNSNGPANQLHLLQLGSMPPAHELQLWHPSLPWTIVIRSSHSNGILVSDVLGNIYAQLMLPIASHDYYNVEMTAEDRERIEAAYKVRCNGDVGLLRIGILRIDFLGSHVGFLGLVRSWNGMWEIRTVNIYDALS